MYTTSMDFSSYSTEICQLKITPTAFLSKAPNIMVTNISAYTVLSFAQNS